MNDSDMSPDDEEASAVVRAVARQLKLWRESAGLTQAEFGAAIGYGEELVSSVERGRRIPRPEYLEAADRVLNAGGRVAAMTRDLAEVRYPKKVRDVRRLEVEAVQICSYNNSVVDGLLQTEDYARAVFCSRRPPFTDEELERQLTARLARQEIIDSATAKPLFSFVLCEATLRRPIGGRVVMRAQLERLLDVARLPNVDLQVLPLTSEENSGLGGLFRLLKLKDGTAVGLSEAPLVSRVFCGPKETTVLDVRYGIIRAQALTPRESLTFIEQLRGET
ncbi:helix-turn-helix transcriptional regulator [Streptomyces sp. NRRL S-340]|uniref:helix-turn-helix domain-containing protein n=1 Tax=Streptomyces sp. NRRL S-340 TaxID=1463901 RepID=UPI000AB33D71|nr:helix-turn-helix transcriptional regulator [Streptomyces sp. NRRL S-340]